MADITSINIIESTTDIADRLETEASVHPADIRPSVLLEAAALIRDLDAAISHAIAVKGSNGLSPWATSVLHEAITRRLRRGDG